MLANLLVYIAVIGSISSAFASPTGHGETTDKRGIGSQTTRDEIVARLNRPSRAFKRQSTSQLPPTTPQFCGNVAPNARFRLQIISSNVDTSFVGQYLGRVADTNGATSDSEKLAVVGTNPASASIVSFTNTCNLYLADSPIKSASSDTFGNNIVRFNTAGNPDQTGRVPFVCSTDIGPDYDLSCSIGDGTAKKLLVSSDGLIFGSFGVNNRIAVRLV